MRSEAANSGVRLAELMAALSIDTRIGWLPAPGTAMPQDLSLYPFSRDAVLTDGTL